jgi:hypothetical protein
MPSINMNVPLVAIFVSLIVGLIPYSSCRANEDNVKINPNAKVIFLFMTKPDDEKAEKGMEAWHQFFENNLQTFTQHVIPGAQPDNKLEVSVQYNRVEIAVSEAFLAASRFAPIFAVQTLDPGTAEAIDS